jgi:hypothetical protein
MGWDERRGEEGGGVDVKMKCGGDRGGWWRCGGEGDQRSSWRIESNRGVGRSDRGTSIWNADYLGLLSVRGKVLPASLLLPCYHHPITVLYDTTIIYSIYSIYSLLCIRTRLNQLIMNEVRIQEFKLIDLLDLTGCEAEYRAPKVTQQLVDKVGERGQQEPLSWT